MGQFMNVEDWFVSVVSGERRGAAASIARGVFTVAEPIYAGVVQTRNFLYTRGIRKADHAQRPVISVGNLTTGGTGKTPIVAWLVGRLREAGHKPAVLLRGYRSAGGASDEELLLRQLVAPSPVKAQANRFSASQSVLAQHPEVDVFVLDDGFQHRRLARCFNLVLVDATSPFGFGHVLPRGLLREPLRALRRASAVVITRADLVDETALDAIETRIRAEQPGVPIFRCAFKQDRLLEADGVARSVETLRGERLFAFCGIGNPAAFFRQLRSRGPDIVGTRVFRDHHPYTIFDVSGILTEAKAVRATMVLTTEKDWVKIAPLASRVPPNPPMLRIGISAEFHGPEAAKLNELATTAIAQDEELLGQANQSHNAEASTQD